MSTVRRMAWMAAEPFARIGYATKVSSYKWVNVSMGARRLDYFDPLWRWQWYGEPIAEMPERVTLHGLRYGVSASEGLVSFVESEPMFGMGSRIWFERDPDAAYPTVWTCQSSGRHVAATHIVRAYEWVEAVFGGTFEKKGSPHPTPRRSGRP